MNISDIKDIILIFLVIAVIYLLFFKEDKEHFTTEDDIKNAVNELYQADIEAIRNLGQISKDIMTNKDNLTLPTNITIPGDLQLNGNLQGNNINVRSDMYIGGTIKPTTGNVRVSLEARELAINGNLQLDGTAALFLKETNITEDWIKNVNLKLKKLESTSSLAGYAIYAIMDSSRNGDSLTSRLYPAVYPLYDGEYSLNQSESSDGPGRFSYLQRNSQWVGLHVHKGWRITCTDSTTNTISVHTNNSDSIPLSFYGNYSSYKAEWVGY